MALTEAGDESVYGGKAVQLGVALRAGLPVPAGVAIPAALVEAVSESNREACAALERACRELERPLAVRSSAVGEDSEAASFAGQHLTRLNVREPHELLRAVSDVYASARSDSALAYRRRLGLTAEPSIGVVVQELVEPACAGVLFTRDPMRGSDEIVIEGAWGLGESVVAGLVTPDRFRVSREGAVLERTVGVKDLAVRTRPDGGTREVPVAPELARTPCLSDVHLAELHALALNCEATFGGTQDLEWAFDHAGALFLLQRRALTATPA